MADPNPGAGAKGPGKINTKNQDDANEADRRTIANVKKNEADQEKSGPQEYRPGT